MPETVEFAEEPPDFGFAIGFFLIGGAGAELVQMEGTESFKAMSIIAGH